MTPTSHVRFGALDVRLVGSTSQLLRRVCFREHLGRVRTVLDLIALLAARNEFKSYGESSTKLVPFLLCMPRGRFVLVALDVLARAPTMNGKLEACFCTRY